MSDEDLKKVFRESKLSVQSTWKKSEIVFEKVQERAFKKSFFELLFTGEKFKLVTSMAAICLIVLIGITTKIDDGSHELHVNDALNVYVELVQEGPYGDVWGEDEVVLEENEDFEQRDMASSGPELLEDVFYVYEHLL
jgi:hypothetical protein